MKKTIGALLLSMALAACGGGSGDTSADPGESAPSTSTSTSEPGTAQEGASGSETEGMMVVTVKDFKYSPASITVKAGTTVRFVNEDPVRHTVTAGTPDSPKESTFDKDLPDGETVEITFDEPGEFAYFCEPHEFMTGTVTVE